MEETTGAAAVAAALDPVHPQSAVPLDQSKGEGLYFNITQKFELAKVPGSSKLRIRTKEVAVAARTVVPMYDSIFGKGILASTLKNDIENSSGKVEDARALFPAERQYIEEFVLHEIGQRGVDYIRKDHNAGVKNLLWMKRALDFIISFMEKCILGDPTLTSKECAREVYNRILQPYHGWTLGSLIKMAFNLCPSRDTLLIKLGFTDLDVAKEKAKLLLACVRPVIDEIDRLLKENHCNFPDKA